MSSGHQTTLVNEYLPTDDFFAYHLARARGGAGLVVLEAHAVHESGLLTDHTIDAALTTSWRRTNRLPRRCMRPILALWHNSSTADGNATPGSTHRPRSRPLTNPPTA
ncbi:hypothetical protein [Haladaptatus pallidirubidus]|uniref:hypothetical protein n=1 Tax=Haladaptatus pallidirubidus TaxID=1008152 RepID=UPI0036F28F78